MRLPHRLSGENSEAGETLIEVLMASALMALIVVAVIGGLATTILGAHVHREQADGNTVLVAVMEHLKSPTEVPRVACATASTYQGEAEVAAVAAGWPATSVSYTIEHETIVPVSGSPTVQWVAPAACVDNGTNTLTLQRIALKLTTTDGRVVPAMSFIKGDY